MSELNEQLNSVEKTVEYIENIPYDQIKHPCVCRILLILGIILEIFLIIIFFIDVEKNAWILIPILALDFPIGYYLWGSGSNSSSSYKKLKLFKIQNDMLAIDIDNKTLFYPIVNANKFSYINENGFAIFFELLDGNKIKLVNTNIEPSTLVEHLNDHLNNLKININPKNS